MESRKVQITGKATFVVSLPKTWVNHVNIKAGDTVGIRSLSDNCLLIDPCYEERDDKPMKLVINAGERDPDMIMRQFIGAYLAGFTVFEIKGHDKIKPLDAHMIRKIPIKMMGPFIVDETESTILLKDLLGSGDFLMGKGLKRMHLIVKDMQSVAIGRLVGGNAPGLVDMGSRDSEVEKLSWMISRQFNRMLKDISLSQKMDMTPREALSCLQVSDSIERIADHSIKIFDNASLLVTGSEHLGDINEVGMGIVELFDQAMKSVYKKGFNEAYDVMLKIRNKETAIDQLRMKISGMSADNGASVAMACIVDSLDRIRCCSKDIAEVAMDLHFANEYDDVMDASIAKSN